MATEPNLLRDFIVTVCEACTLGHKGMFENMNDGSGLIEIRVDAPFPENQMKMDFTQKRIVAEVRAFGLTIGSQHRESKRVFKPMMLVHDEIEYEIEWKEWDELDAGCIRIAWDELLPMLQNVGYELHNMLHPQGKKIWDE